MSIGKKIEEIVNGIVLIVNLISKSGILNKDRYYIEREGIRLECASLAKNIAEINRRLCPNEIVHKYTVNNENLICDLKYKGVVRKDNTSELLFTFTTTNQVSYSEMVCYAIEGKNTTIPNLIGPDGLIKKLAVRFLKNKNKGDSYNIDFHIDLGKCIVSRRDYILSITKYAQIEGKDYQVIIDFKNTQLPENIRVYELKKGKMEYDKTIFPNNNSFIDMIEKPEGISLRAYIFDR